KWLPKFTPSRYLSFSVHLDGPAEEHDHAVCRDGTYDIAVKAIKAAIAAGFRVTTNSTLFNTADPARYREFFDTLMDIGVEGMMAWPGSLYEKAPDKDIFLHSRERVGLFPRLLAKPKRRWGFNQSPLFLEFLKGNWNLECPPGGSPAYNIFG